MLARSPSTKGRRTIGAMARAAVKGILHSAGLLSAIRRFTHGETLTVLMLHRVLPRADPRAETADWDYTMSLETFAPFARLLKSEFNTISLDILEAAMRERKPLPRRALLITFDDAWEDTARYAVPVLDALGLPSTIFVPSGVLESQTLIWEDVVGMLYRAGCLGQQAGDDRSRLPLSAVVAQMKQLTPVKRQEILDKALQEAGAKISPLMMSRDDFSRLPKSVSLAAHGVNHVAFTALPSVEYEVVESWRVLTKMRGGHAPESFAFPYGAHTKAHISEVLKAGFNLVYTVEACINRLEGRRVVSPVIGRLGPSERDLTDERGRFHAGRTAYWLAVQPQRIIEA